MELVTYRTPAVNPFVNGKVLLPGKVIPPVQNYTRTSLNIFHFTLSSKRTHHWAVTQTKDCFFTSVFALNPNKPRYAPAFLGQSKKCPPAQLL